MLLLMVIISVPEQRKSSVIKMFITLMFMEQALAKREARGTTLERNHSRVR
jgi:hypothetical protein